MLQYVLLWHDCPADYREGSHWDLMLERSDVVDEHRLATWSLSILPNEWLRLLGHEGESAEGPIVAERLADHRAAYLDYEGPVSGDRGAVTRWASGPVEWLAETPELVHVRLSELGELRLALDASSPEWHLTL